MIMVFKSIQRCFVISAFSVCSRSLKVVVEHGHPGYNLSDIGRKCLLLLQQLQIYCVVKGSLEDPNTEAQVPVTRSIDKCS